MKTSCGGSPTSFITTNEKETRLLAEEIGKHIQTGLVICLQGEMGAGKTVFVQGLALGLGVPPTTYVTSPTYTLVNRYSGRFPLYHADLCRLAGIGEIEEIGFEELIASDHVVAVEWPERMDFSRFAHRLEVSIKSIAETGRHIFVIAYGLARRLLLKSMDAKLSDFQER